VLTNRFTCVAASQGSRAHRKQHTLQPAIAQIENRLIAESFTPERLALQRHQPDSADEAPIAAAMMAGCPMPAIAGARASTQDRGHVEHRRASAGMK
jgi:hypothetical protein